jgi:hypothetical protein
MEVDEDMADKENTIRLPGSIEVRQKPQNGGNTNLCSRVVFFGTSQGCNSRCTYREDWWLGLMKS